MSSTNSHDFSEPALETAPPHVSKPRKHAPVWRRRDVHILLLAALFIVLLAFFAWAASEADEGDVIVASANSAQNSHSATLLTDGRVLVAGGWSGNTAIAAADLFDADARTWAPTAPLLTPRIFHAATRLSDGRVLATGGWDNNGDILSSAEIYDPANAAWLPAAPLRNARAGHASLTLPDGRVLVVGGCFGSQASGAVSSPGQPWDVQSMAEVYDPRANSWQAAGQLAEGRCWPTATLLGDGRVLVVGGSDRAGRPVAGAELYDPLRGSWSSAGRLRVAREGHTATLLPDGQVLVAGGYSGEALASTELYNPAANTWTPAASMRQARAYHTAALLQNGKVLVIGGATSSFPSQDTEAYHPESNTWTPAGPLPAPYAFHLTTVLANGRVVVTGRPGSNDPTGNDGYPTPMGGAQTPTPRGTPGIPQHLANPSSGGTMGSQGMSAVEGGEGTTPTPCSANLPMGDPAAADSFVAAYAFSAKQHGINVLRALAFGNWAYSDTDLATPTPFPTSTPGASCAAEDWKCQHFVGTRHDACLPDLSLYFSNSPYGSSTDLFDGGPEHAQIQPGSYPSSGYYPNLHSFQRTDRKLKLLLDQYPSMYVQVLLVTEPYHNARDTEWREINTTLRTQLWQNMIARWGAFPNVFWSVSNDLGDTSGYPGNRSLADEIGCYWINTFANYGLRESGIG